MSDFDFDAWANLARRSPHAYFRARERYIDDLIKGYPPDEAARMREFQIHIDSVRANAGSPLRATREMMGMISDRLEAISSRCQVLRRVAREMEHLQAHLVNLDLGRPRSDKLD